MVMKRRTFLQLLGTVATTPLVLKVEPVLAQLPEIITPEHVRNVIADPKIATGVIDLREAVKWEVDVQEEAVSLGIVPKAKGITVKRVGRQNTYLHAQVIYTPETYEALRTVFEDREGDYSFLCPENIIVDGIMTVVSVPSTRSERIDISFKENFARVPFTKDLQTVSLTVLVSKIYDS